MLALLFVLLVADPAGTKEPPSVAIDERCDVLARLADPKRTAPRVLVEDAEQWRERTADDDHDAQAEVTSSEPVFATVSKLPFAQLVQ